MTKVRNILVTGVPGVGKTTLITNVASRLAAHHPVGFYTREIREHGSRRGFEAVDFDGRKALLAHADHRSPHRVGMYGVDLPGFESFLASLDLPPDPPRPVILDEIGKMECFSPRFCNLVTTLLDSPCPLLASIALHGGGVIAAVKARADVRVLGVTSKNRNNLISELADLMRALANA